MCAAVFAEGQAVERGFERKKLGDATSGGVEDGEAGVVESAADGEESLPSGETIMRIGMSLTMATDWPAGVTPQPLKSRFSLGARFWVWRMCAELTELVAERVAVGSGSVSTRANEAGLGKLALSVSNNTRLNRGWPEAARLHDDLRPCSGYSQRYASASNVMGCTTRKGISSRRAPLMICSRQPGLAVATTCARRADVVQFAVEKFVGHFRLDQIVNARAAAAPGAFGQFDQFQIRNRLQDLARLRGDFLAVAQMAGLVIGHGLRGGCWLPRAA